MPEGVVGKCIKDTWHFRVHTGYKYDIHKKIANTKSLSLMSSSKKNPDSEWVQTAQSRVFQHGESFGGQELDMGSQFENMTTTGFVGIDATIGDVKALGAQATLLILWHESMNKTNRN